MDEKRQTLQPVTPTRSFSGMPGARIPRRLRVIVLTVLILCACGLWYSHFTAPAVVSVFPGLNITNYTLGRTNTKKRVPLEAHVMSKCPDARDCLRDLIMPIMPRVNELVDFTLSFIGEVDKDDGVTCKHGEGECLGNMFALCAADLYPNSTKISLGFSNCLISSYKEIPSRNLVEGCALEHAVDFGKLNACASEAGHGLDLLTQSVKRSKDSGVKYSCTVRLSDEIRCIRDSGKWKDCQGGSKPGDLIRDVEMAYKKLNE